MNYNEAKTLAWKAYEEAIAPNKEVYQRAREVYHRARKVYQNAID